MVKSEQHFTAAFRVIDRMTEVLTSAIVLQMKTIAEEYALSLFSVLLLKQLRNEIVQLVESIKAGFEYALLLLLGGLSALPEGLASACLDSWHWGVRLERNQDKKPVRERLAKADLPSPDAPLRTDLQILPPTAEGHHRPIMQVGAIGELHAFEQLMNSNSLLARKFRLGRTRHEPRLSDLEKDLTLGQLRRIKRGRLTREDKAGRRGVQYNLYKEQAILHATCQQTGPRPVSRPSQRGQPTQQEQDPAMPEGAGDPG
jgi:hypothetical protein